MGAEIVVEEHVAAPGPAYASPRVRERKRCLRRLALVLLLAASGARAEPPDARRVLPEVYTREDACCVLEGAGVDPRTLAEADGKIMSAFVRATKPGLPA